MIGRLWPPSYLKAITLLRLTPVSRPETKLISNVSAAKGHITSKIAPRKGITGARTRMRPIERTRRMSMNLLQRRSRPRTPIGETSRQKICRDHLSMMTARSGSSALNASVRNPVKPASISCPTSTPSTKMTIHLPWPTNVITLLWMYLLVFLTLLPRTLFLLRTLSIMTPSSFKAPGAPPFPRLMLRLCFRVCPFFGLKGELYDQLYDNCA